MFNKPPIPPDQRANPRFRLRKRQAQNTVISRYLDPFVETLKTQGIPFANEELSDSEVILLATAMIDQVLRFAIIGSFRVSLPEADVIALFEGNGPFSTFDAKIRVAGALYIVTTEDAKHDLNIIRTIRNIFAHSMTRKAFTDQDIRDRCAKLTFRSKNHKTTREQFIVSCANILKEGLTSVVFASHSFNLIIKNWGNLSHETAITLANIYETSPVLKALAE